MAIRNFAIEMARTHPQAIIVALHPGTVDTHLSRPFQRGVTPKKLFTPEFSATAHVGGARYADPSRQRKPVRVGRPKDRFLTHAKDAQKIGPADQRLRRMRPAIYVAQEMGAGLGQCPFLLRPLPVRKGQPRKRVESFAISAFRSSVNRS